jgi:hypothetical protein
MVSYCPESHEAKPEDFLALVKTLTPTSRPEGSLGGILEAAIMAGAPSCDDFQRRYSHKM